MNNSVLAQLQEAKKALAEAKKSTALSKFVDPFLDVLIVLAFMFAGLKDLADISLGLMPIWGQIFCWVISVLAAIFIFLIMNLLGGRHFSFVVKRLLVILIGFLIESLPGLQLFPLETVVVFINYALVLKERRQDIYTQKERELEGRESEENYTYQPA
jgi:hypothetical protein